MSKRKNEGFANRDNFFNKNEVVEIDKSKFEEEKTPSKQYSSFKFDKKKLGSGIDITMGDVYSPYEIPS